MIYYQFKIYNIVIKIFNVFLWSLICLLLGLECVLRNQNLSDLYSVFIEHEITPETVWSLSEENCKEMGLSIGDRKRYLLAANKRNETDQETANSELLLNYIYIKLYIIQI